MTKLVIEKIDGYNYYLKDKDNNLYKYNIEFYDLPITPSINDQIYVNENFLKEQNTMLSYGPLDGIYGREVNSSQDEDLLILVRGNDKIYLKRYYG